MNNENFKPQTIILSVIHSGEHYVIEFISRRTHRNKTVWDYFIRRDSYPTVIAKGTTNRASKQHCHELLHGILREMDTATTKTRTI